MSKQNIDELSVKIVEEFQAFWGSKSADFCISEATDVPYRMATIEFSLYNYVLVRLQIERDSAWFAQANHQVLFHLLPNSTPIGQIASRLQEVDTEVRLRIPEKFLNAKSW